MLVPRKSPGPKHIARPIFIIVSGTVDLTIYLAVYLCMHNGFISVYGHGIINKSCYYCLTRAVNSPSFGGIKKNVMKFFHSKSRSGVVN